jgi:hypothetical protein
MRREAAFAIQKGLTVMTTRASRRLLVAAAVLAALAVFALGFFVALGIQSVVAGPESAPKPAPPSPGHSWSEIGDLPGTMWHSNNDGPGSGPDADTVDGKHASEVGGISSCWEVQVSGGMGERGDLECAEGGGYCTSMSTLNDLCSTVPGQSFSTARCCK